MSQLESVKNYYGKVLSTKADLQTTACCTAEAMPPHLLGLLRNVEDEIKDRFYGCGAPFPEVLKGATVLDLGCGTGRDVYMLSQIVGETGRVIGIDMTEEQIEVARKYESAQMQKFGYSSSNVEFHQGYIEDLESVGIQNESVDLIVSNCVVNLSPEKERVFREAFRVLKPGGELYFSDVFCDRRLSKESQEDPVLLGECLGGALYVEDFRRMIAGIGCKDHRVMNTAEIKITNPEIKAKVGGARFYSITIRAFKLDLEDRCEDYGQVAYYNGEAANCPVFFELDDHHKFERGKPMPVCQNTARMLKETRFAPYFRVEGDTSIHYGLFDCAPLTTSSSESSPAACC